MDYKNFLKRLISSLFLICVYFFLYYYYSDKIIYFVTFIYLIIIIEIFLFFKTNKFLIISYILISLSFVFIYFYLSFDKIEFTIIILCIAFFDSACYLTGKTIGRNKILINVSPNKTYEGLFGGIFLTNLVCLIFYLSFDLSIIDYNLFILANLVIVFSFFGDVIQSYFKRLNYLKDSGNFMPGHGGFFDRFDSFLLVIIPISVFNLFF